MRVYTSNGVWKGSGKGVMACVKQCCFSSNGGSSDVRWLSDNFTATTDGYYYHASKEVWWKDAITILQGLDANAQQANVAGGIFYYYDDDALGPNYLFAGLYPPPGPFANTKGFANSFFVGIPGGGHVRRHTDYHVTGGGWTWMERVTSAMCVLNEAGGVGSSDWSAQINFGLHPTFGDYYWKLSAVLGGATSVSAGAECYSYDQSQ